MRPYFLLLSVVLTSCIPLTAQDIAESGPLVIAGSTRYEMTGLVNPKLINNTVVVDQTSKPVLQPFGYVEISTEVGAELRIKAEQIQNSAKVTLSTEPFGTGYKVLGSGLVYVDVTSIVKKTITVPPDQELTYIASYEQASISFTITKDVDPEPDDPEPAPSPFTEPGLRVLIVYDNNSYLSYPTEQRAIIDGTPMRVWLNAITVEYRALDDDAAGGLTPTAKKWLQALARKRNSLPWIIIGNGKTGYEGPLPATIQETQTLIEKYK